MENNSMNERFSLKWLVGDPNVLYAVEKRLRLASGWKESTQRLMLNQLRIFNEIHKDLMKNGAYVIQKPNTFVLDELGKKRLISALKPKDVLIQHALCDAILTPVLSKYLIHDNGASLKHKGLSFTRKRFESHMHKFFRQYGKNGYILKIDFRKYFDNIDHEKLLEAVSKKFPGDKILMELIADILKCYEVDVSYSNDPNIKDKIFNSLEYNRTVPNELRTGIRMMRKSLGIGSPISQIFGIFFPYMVDNYCKTVLGLKYYDAYMDDRIIIFPDKKILKKILKVIEGICNDVGIHINKNKTQIVKLTHPFTFLKTQYILTDSGKLIRKIPKDVVLRERKKLKKLAFKVISKEMTFDAYVEQYQSWVGDKKRYHAHKTLHEMNIYFKRICYFINHAGDPRNPKFPFPHYGYHNTFKYNRYVQNSNEIQNQ